MKEPKISVIVPIYKVEPYLRKCLDSIVNQTYRNLEIILVDERLPGQLRGPFVTSMPPGMAGSGSSIRRTEGYPPPAMPDCPP